MKREAFAKINLTLEVAGTRPDGYHDLKSVVLPVSLSDTVEVEPRGDAEITVEVEAGSGISLEGMPSSGKDNLAWRAADALRRAAGMADAGADIRIAKRIPLGGGLGGGSADAAAVLAALNEVWGFGFSRERLAETAALVGSDVPALVLGGPVLMEGRGEKVARWPADGRVPDWHFVLVNPGVHSSTPAVYRAADSYLRLTSDSQIIDNMRLAFSCGRAEALASAMCNDLAKAACALYPEIADAAAALEGAGALNAVVTGSGATVAGVVRGVEHGKEVRARLGGRFWTACVSACPVV